MGQELEDAIASINWSPKARSGLQGMNTDDESQRNSDLEKKKSLLFRKLSNSMTRFLSIIFIKLISFQHKYNLCAMKK